MFHVWLSNPSEAKFLQQASDMSETGTHVSGKVLNSASTAAWRVSTIDAIA
jgi:hypothetical protein